MDEKEDSLHGQAWAWCVGRHRRRSGRRTGCPDCWWAPWLRSPAENWCRSRWSRSSLGRTSSIARYTQRRLTLGPGCGPQKHFSCRRGSRGWVAPRRPGINKPRPAVAFCTLVAFLCLWSGLIALLRRRTSRPSPPAGYGHARFTPSRGNPPIDISFPRVYGLGLSFWPVCFSRSWRDYPICFFIFFLNLFSVLLVFQFL